MSADHNELNLDLFCQTLCTPLQSLQLNQNLNQIDNLIQTQCHALDQQLHESCHMMKLQMHLKLKHSWSVLLAMKIVDCDAQKSLNEKWSN